jgi:hypothetical protein
MSLTVGAAAALPRLQHAALPRIGGGADVLLPTLPQTPTVGATQRSRAVRYCELAHAKVWFALGLARVIGTASDEQRRTVRYSGVPRAINSHTATAV